MFQAGTQSQQFFIFWLKLGLKFEKAQEFVNTISTISFNLANQAESYDLIR